MNRSNILHNTCAAILAFVCLSANVFAQESAELLADGFDLPWSIEFLDEDRILVSEREGRIKTLSLKHRTVQSIDGVWPVAFAGQGGLLDLAVHPSFPEQPWLYATFSRPHPDGSSTALVRFQINSKQVTDLERLFVSYAVASGGRHFGSRIAFDDKGYLFMTSGDRGERDWAQDLLIHAGKILRLRDDGTIPTDNPFINQEGAQPEIWSYGHRNPQGIFFDKARGLLWSIEHGPRGGDEINIVKKAANYGWPVISYGKEYWGPISVGEGTEKEGMEQPVKYYTPSIAPSGLLVHQGDLYAGALKLQHINHVGLDVSGRPTSEIRLFETMGQRIRDVIEGPDGRVYFRSDQGSLYRF